MKLLSKLLYQVRKNGLDVTKTSDDVKIMNILTNKYIRILPTGRIISDDSLGHDKTLKDLMSDFLVKDPFLYSRSFIALPCIVSLHVGKGALQEDITFATNCLMQSFASVRSFKLVKDDNLSPTECMVKHEYALSFKQRQAFINACLKYLQ